MVGTGARVARGAIPLVLVLLGAGIGPRGVAAAEEATLVLPGTTLTAFTVDLDGDGDREIVRLLQDENGMDRTVDAWGHDGAGWSMIGATPMPRATRDDEPGTGFAEDAVAMMLWHVAGRERILALSAAVDLTEMGGATCCMTISEVGLSTRGGIEVRRVQRLGDGAQFVQAADVDADGADDLILHQPRIGTGEGGETATLTVMRWSGSAFEQVFELTDPDLLRGVSVGESDGVAGDDILYGPMIDAELHRLAWSNGEIRADETHIDVGGPQEGWVSGIADGAIVLSLADAVSVVRWDRGRAPVAVGRLPSDTYPFVTIVGDGRDALVVVQDSVAIVGGATPATTVYDAELRPLGEVGVSPATEGFWRLVGGELTTAWGDVERNLYPYSGPLFGGVLDGRAAYVSSGILIQPGGPEGYEARPIASLIGVQPIGVAGPADAWAVVGDGFHGAPLGAAYLSWGGVPLGWGRLAITPRERLLRPDDEVTAASFELRNAVEIARDGATTLMADGDGFQATVTAAPGSVVIVADRSGLEDHEVGDEPLLVEILPRTNRQEELDEEFEVTLLVISPDGRGTTRHLTGTFVREPPEISVTAATDTMALAATLVGRASPGSLVTANGRAIATDDDGRFHASIDAPIWPSRVVVMARDPLGNESTQLIEVVGVIDYRGLPWTAILVVATLVVGGVLYIRTPRRRTAVPAPGAEGDGHLEELELGAIDGRERGGR